MKKIKVIYILHSTDEMGGSSKSFLMMLKGLAQIGIQPLVILPDYNGLYKSLSSEGFNVTVVKFRFSIYPQLHTTLDYLKFIPRLIFYILLNRCAERSLEKIVKDYMPQIIHSNSSVVGIGQKVASKLRIPHIWHVREYGDKDFSLKYFPSRSAFLSKIRNSSYSICITNALKEYLILDSKRSVVIYNGILPQQNLKFEEQKEDFFLYAGRIEKNKGLEELLLAYANFLKMCPDSNIKLKVAGQVSDSLYMKSVLEKINRLGICSEVHFVGQCEKIYDLMSKAYLVIVPSEYEAFGRVVAEAMFSGALVLGHNVAGIKEQFDNGLLDQNNEIGLRYNTNKEMAQQMCNVVEKGIRYYFPMIKLSQEVVRKYYATEANVARIYNFYQEILEPCYKKSGN